MKTMPLSLGIAIAASAICTLPASAQDAAPASAAEAAPVTTPEAAPVATPAPVPVPVVITPEAPKPVCELHVFPTLEGQAMTTTMLSGFGIIGAVADAAQNKSRNISEAEYLKEALGPRLQIEALKSVDVLASLKLPPSQIIYETPIADRKITTQAKTRLSSSAAPCYVELIITQNFYKKAAIYGRSLNNRFVLKDFRGGKTTAELVKGRGGNGLTYFPPKTTDETENAEKDLREAFAKNFTEFAAGVRPAK
ncbi:hypothetical protein [Sphingomonas sp.]|uniref:hypothetical protein n=1 Tax=Sphingomonas sp. TaxID=28214 RepID=UPI0025E77E95|nr:hypothetical protein [Sphingomonas sp.]